MSTDTPTPDDQFRVEEAPASPGFVTIVRNSDNRGVLSIYENTVNGKRYSTPVFADRKTGERVLSFLNGQSTPTPERVTLTDEERKTLAFADRLDLPAAVERILAAREQALREEIAMTCDEEADREFAAAKRTEAAGVDPTHHYGQRLGLEVAARIARGSR